MARPGFVAYLFVVQCTTAVLCRCFYIRFVLPLIRALLGKEEAEEKIRTHWLCLPVHKIESDIQLRLQTATINSEKENSTKQIHSNKFVPIKNREGNAETTTGKTGCLDKYNTAYPVTNSKYLYHFSRKESGRFEHPDNYFYFCGLLKRIILKSNNEHVW